MSADDGVRKDRADGTDLNALRNRAEVAERRLRLYRALYRSANGRAEEYRKMLQEALEW